MTDTLRAAAQQALEYLEAPSAKLWPAGTLHNITNALRAALAQPSGEPVAYWISKAEQFSIAKQGERPFAKAWQPLYAAPQPAPARVPLTDGHIDQMFKDAEVGIYFAERERRRALEIYSFGVRDAETAHGIKEKT